MKNEGEELRGRMKREKARRLILSGAFNLINQTTD